MTTGVPFSLTFNIISSMIDDIVLVSEAEMKQAIFTLLETTRQFAEGAGAASTAAAIKLHERIRDTKVALPLTGRNLTLQTLREIIDGKLT